MGRVAAVDAAALLQQQTITGAGSQQLCLQCTLGAQIGGRDKFSWPLDRDLQLLHLAKISDETARRLARGVRHDIDDR